MDYSTREEILNDLQHSFHSLMDSYELDDIGLFEEQGPDNQYYMGYTISRNGKAYMLHQTYKMGHDGALSLLSGEWTIESDEPNYNDKRGFQNLENAFNFLY